MPSTLAKEFTSLSPKLDPESLTARAQRKTGLQANLSSRIGTALEVLCRSVRDEANLHWFGRVNFANLLNTGLSQLLLINDRFERQPELDQQPLNAPIFVTGMPRSGTTFLHRLLSSPSKTAAMPLYRLFFPNGGRFSKLNAEGLFYGWKVLSKRYGMDAIHYIRPGLPDECNFGMRLDIHSLIYWATGSTYSYLKWCLDQDMDESYKTYRRVLQLQQMRHPDKRLVLKCPHHLAWLPSLAKVFPEATIVQTHREPKEIIPSECKLVTSSQGMSTDRLDWKASVDANNHKSQTFASRAIEFAKKNTSTRVIHVRYSRLIKDPVALAKEIFDQINLNLSEEEIEEVRVFFSSNKKDKRGRNKYNLEQYGLSEDALNKDYSEYRELFLDPDAPFYGN